MSVGLREGVLCALVAVCVGAGLIWARVPGGVGLLDVSGVEPGLLERGDTLRVLGAGFPAGRDGQVVLVGSVRRPGVPPQALRLTLPCHARSAERAEVLLDDDACARFGGRGSFDGMLEVHFAAAHEQGDVIGRLSHVELDLLSSLGRAAREDQVLRERATELFARAGIVAADSDTLHGLDIAGVVHGGAAERAGLRAGDVIVAASGVRVHALSDMAPLAHAVALPIRVARADAPAVVALTLPLGSRNAIALASDGSRLRIIFVFVLLALLFLSPLPSPSPMLLRAASALRKPSLVVAAQPPDARGRAQSGLALLAAALCMPLMASEVRPVDLSLLLVALLALLWASQLRTPRRLLGLAVPVCVLLFVFGCACVSGGTSALAGLVGQQGATPLAWKVFSHPELGLGFALFAVHGTRVLASSGRPPLVLWLARWLLATLGACVFLGGYVAGFGAASAGWFSLGLGTALLTAKTAALMWLLANLRLPARRPSLLGTAAACLCVALGTLAWLQVDEPRVVEPWLASVVLPTLLLGGLFAWLQIRSARKPQPHASVQLSPTS